VHSITVANDESLVDLIAGANRRLIMMAPAFTEAVALAIRDKWLSLGSSAVNVIIDVDPEVYRLGYGEPGALDLLLATAKELGTTLNRQRGVRIGLVIADDCTLIYSPTPLLVEAGGKSPETPNAVLLNGSPSELERELGEGPEGMTEQSVGLDPVEGQEIAAIKADLQKNPPQKFDIARVQRVFNAQFEFVELSLVGTHINQMKARIPEYLLGVADERTQAQLHASFNLVSQEDEMSGSHLEADKKIIAKRFLKIIPNYGTVVLRKDKEKFQEQVEQLEHAVKKFQENLIDRLAISMERNRLALMEALLPRVVEHPPKQWLASFETSLVPATVQQLLDADLRAAFGEAARLVGAMEVKCLFKGVTYEMLKDKAFVEAAKKVIPDFPKLHEEYNAAIAKTETDQEA